MDFIKKIQFNLVDFKGIGQTTGEKYHITTNFESHNFVSEDGSPQTQTAIGKTHVTRGINEKGKTSIKFTVNANGEIKVDDVKIKLDCS